MMNDIGVEFRKNPRKKANLAAWKQNIAKTKRVLGQEYHGRKKVNGTWLYNIKKLEKVVKARCNCSSKLTLCSSFSDDDRNLICSSFYKGYKTWGEKKVAIYSLVDQIGTSDHKHRQIAEKSRRNATLNYNLMLKNVRKRVCKKMFVSTLAISEKLVYNALKKFTFDESNPNFDIPIRKITIPVNVVKKRSSAEKFLGKLNKMESHYCRKYTSKIYLEPFWRSLGHLFREYQKYCVKKCLPNAGITLFRKIFVEMNLGLFLPKKDQCDVCCGFKTGNVSLVEYELHRSNKQMAQDEKTKDTKSVSQKFVFTMDQQSVLLSPYLKASATYYKTKLAVHYFTLFDNKTKDGFCNLWHEGEGGVTSNEFATIVCNFIESLPTVPGDDLIFYSDGCTYQNRNVTMSNALSNMAMLKKVVIYQKILEKGHTQMQCDSIHSTIERRIRNDEIYCPKDYVLAALEARVRRPYTVHYLEHHHFKNFDSLDYYKSIRPGENKTGEPVVTNIRCLMYLPDGTIKYKLSYASKIWKVLPQKRFDAPAMPLAKVPQLYNAEIKISGQKYKHLQQLKAVIPTEHHEFYDNLDHLEIPKKSGNKTTVAPVGSKPDTSNKKSTLKKSAVKIKSIGRATNIQKCRGEPEKINTETTKKSHKLRSGSSKIPKEESSKPVSKNISSTTQKSRKLLSKI